MLMYLACAFITFIAPFVAFPLLLDGRSGNSMFTIHMPFDQQAYRGYWECVYAQELSEWLGAWVGAFVLAAPVAYLLMPTPFALLTPVVVLIAWNWRSTVWGERLLEYLGWATEAAYGHLTSVPVYDEGGRAYAQRLRSGYPRLFSDTDITQVEAGLRRAAPLARLLARGFRYRISRARMC